MSFHFVSHPWEVQDVQDGTLVVFTQRDLDPVNVHVLVDELYEIVCESGQPNLYMDFSQVHFMGSLVIGKLIALNAKLRTIGGKIVLKNIDPVLHDFFRNENATDFLDPRRSEYEESGAVVGDASGVA